jgi:hypothetical protein
MSEIVFNNKFMGLSGPIEYKQIFNRSVWHDGDKLRANMLNNIYEKQSNTQSAGLSIKHILYEQIGAVVK